MKRLLVLLLAACAPEDPHTVAWINPSDELRPYFERALSRWERAGLAPNAINITNAGGIPAYLVSGQIEVDGSYYDGYMFGGEDSQMQVNRWTTWGIERVVAHEICHIFGHHSDDGICSTDLTNSFINTKSLEAACGEDSQYCDSFNPEVP